MCGREAPLHHPLFPGCEGTALVLLARGLCGWGSSGQRPAKCRTGVAPACPWRAAPSCLWRSRRPGRKKWRWAARGGLSWRWRGGAGSDTDPAGAETGKIKHWGNSTLKDCVTNKTTLPVIQSSGSHCAETEMSLWGLELDTKISICGHLRWGLLRSRREWCSSRRWLWPRPFPPACCRRWSLRVPASRPLRTQEDTTFRVESIQTQDPLQPHALQPS